MKYTNHQSGNGGFISLENEEEEIGRLTYTLFPEDNKMIISFVMVYPKYEGKGMGKFLVVEAIKMAKNNHWKIYPHCSYARFVMKKMTGLEEIII